MGQGCTKVLEQGLRPALSMAKRLKKPARLEKSAHELIREGLRHSQAAALQRDARERLDHLHRARESLTLALSVGAGRGLSEAEAESVRMHLTAVMKKLGANLDPRPEGVHGPWSAPPKEGEEEESSDPPSDQGKAPGDVGEQIRELHLLVEQETEARSNAMAKIETLTERVGKLTEANGQLEGKVRELEGRRRVGSRGGQSRQGQFPPRDGKGVQDLGAVLERDGKGRDYAAPPALGGFAIDAHAFPSPSFAARESEGGRRLRQTELNVHVLNGVSVEEQAQFQMPVDLNHASTDLLKDLDRHCQLYVGLSVARLQYVATVFRQGQRRHERRPIDDAVVTEIVQKLEAQAREGGSARFALCLCTIPLPPVQEMAVRNVRLRDIQPSHVPFSSRQKIVIRTTPLALEASYQVALTNQWDCGKTFLVSASCLPDGRGVELAFPLAMQTPTCAGLYDVHLVIDDTYRSENRRAITISGEDDTASESTESSQR